MRGTMFTVEVSPEICLMSIGAVSMAAGSASRYASVAR